MERTIVVRVLTRCRNLDQFVATFRRLSTDTAVFVPTQNRRDVGEAAAFSIQLADGAVALAGHGAITARDDAPDNVPDNAFGKPGIWIDIHQLAIESQPVFDRMRAASLTMEMAPLFPEPLALEDDDGSGVVEATSAHQDATVRVGAPRDGCATTLGVAPLAPATFVSAPFVVDTPVQRWPRASRPDLHRPAPPQLVSALVPVLVPIERAERTAMVALDRVSGEPQPGPWQAFCSRVAHSIRTAGWWLTRRRSTQRIRAVTSR